MKVTLVMVMSANGRTTDGDRSPNFWASAEDQVQFEELKSKAQVIVMGRKTYDAAKNHVKDDGKKRIVMSRATHTPKGVIADLEAQGITEMLLVGGSELNADFFKEKLVDEVYLTIEPLVFATGLPLVRPSFAAQNLGGLAHTAPFEVELELLNIKQLNSQGTLLLHYKCLNNKK